MNTTRNAPIPPLPAGASEPPPFESAIKRLTEIVQTLERGDLTLEQSLELFEEGVKLSRASRQRLDAAERRVEQLLSVDEQGRTKTAPFASDAVFDAASGERDTPPF
jgi:exodeoxyribonuclease VII small subunit